MVGGEVGVGGEGGVGGGGGGEEGGGRGCEFGCEYDGGRGALAPWACTGASTGASAAGAWAGASEGGGRVERSLARSNLQRRIKIEHHRYKQDRGAYWIAGNGSATDSATAAMRLKIATAIDGRIVSDVVKVVEI